MHLSIIRYIIETTGVQIHELFYRIEGWGTGGLLALGLSRGTVTIDDIEELYSKNNEEIIYRAVLASDNTFDGLAPDNTFADMCPHIAVCVPDVQIENMPPMIASWREKDHDIPVWATGCASGVAPKSKYEYEYERSAARRNRYRDMDDPGPLG